MSEVASISVNGKTVELPVITGTENEKAIDISKLRDLTGAITLDTGYKNTGATQSEVTFLDGEEGILQYRGYPIEQLAEKSTFLEVAYLLIYGELPSAKKMEEFRQLISKHTLIHEDRKKFFDGFPSKSHPMGQLSCMVGALSALYPKSLDAKRSDEGDNRSAVK